MPNSSGSIADDCPATEPNEISFELIFDENGNFSGETSGSLYEELTGASLDFDIEFNGSDVTLQIDGSGPLPNGGRWNGTLGLDGFNGDFNMPLSGGGNIFGGTTGSGGPYLGGSIPFRGGNIFGGINSGSPYVGGSIPLPNGGTLSGSTQGGGTVKIEIPLTIW